MWIRFVIFIGIMWIIQVVLTYFQMKHYQKRMVALKRKGRIGVGTTKGRITSGVIIILAVNPRGVIVDAEIMRGVSVFARFKKIKDLIGENIGKQIKTPETFKEKEVKSFEMALESITGASN